MNSTVKHIVLLGASVGKAWNILQLPERISNQNYRFEYVGLYQFDKTHALKELLKRKQSRPDAIFIKECAAYFPSDISFVDSKRLMKQWIKDCFEKEVVPIPTTVCPITRTRDERFITKNPVKRIIKTLRGINMHTCMDRIREYNDWIKSYAEKNKLVVLDLENPLIVNKKDRYLRDDLTNGDGLHLNSKAYGLIDKIVFPTLEQVSWLTSARS
jgi:hypothetical protein